MKRTHKILSLLLCLALTLSCLFGCKKKEGLITEEENLLSGYSRSSSVPEYNFKESADLMPENYSIYIGASQTFALNLLKETATTEKNTVLSPLAVSELLVLLSNGAASQTSQNLRSAAGSTLGLSELNLCNYYLRQRIQSISAESTFQYSASLWLNNRFDVKSSFLQTAADYFNAGIIRTDFSGDKIYEKINGYVNECTGKDGKVQSISSDGMIYALSDVFLKDSWLTAFDSSKLATDTFHGASGDKDAVYMTSSEAYLSTDLAEGFTKSLKGTPLKFTAIIPKENVSIKDFLAEFSANDLNDLLKSEAPAVRKTVAIPSFFAESNLALKDSLKALSVTKAFDSENANFSDMTGSGSVYLNDVLHYSSLGFSESGISDSESNHTAEKKAVSADLRFDRPFIYLIWDNESGIPVFIGSVENPS